MLGGASRSDVASTIVIRPLSVLFGAYALTVAKRGDIRRIATPLLLLGGLAIVHGIQLVPLPPGLWHLLAGHAVVADNDRLIGLADAWRPISLSPSRTWNGLASLVVPAAALVLTAIQRGRHAATIILVLMGVAAASAALGLAQLGGGADAPLYLYRFTNPGRAVGLFANPNHHAAFLAAVIVLAAWSVVFARGLPGRAPGRQALGLGIGGLCAVGATACGSRAGFVLMIVALMAGHALILLSRRATPSHARRPRPITTRRRWIHAMLYAGLAVASVLAFLFYDRIPAVSRLTAGDAADDLRFQVLPTLLSMVGTYLPFGSGFGSFEYVFKLVEPDALLSPTYLNQAHDDLLQVLIEGGVPGLLLLLGIAAYVRRIPAAWGAIRTRHPSAESLLPAAALACVGLLILASATDYPLRTPSLMVFVAILVALVPAPGGPASRAKAVE